MVKWLTVNAGTIFIVCLLLVIVFFIIRNMIKKKQKGASSCGCGCSNCGLSGKCHSK